MRKTLILFPIIFILLIFCALATTIQIPGNSADAFSCARWTESNRITPKNCSLINQNSFNVFATAGFDEGDAYWNFTTASYPGISGASWAGYSGFGSDVNVPLNCYQQNPIQIKEWATFTCSYSCNGAFLDCYNGTAWQQIAAANSGDEYPNFINQGAALNITYSGSSCNLGCPSANCVFFDNMNYSSNFESCGYQVDPQFQNLTPTYNYFFSPKTSDLQHPYLQPAAFYPKVSDKFTLNFIATAGNSDLCGYLEQSGFLEHQLIYQSGLTNIPAYDITFYYDTTTHEVTIYALMPGNYLETIATNAINPYYDAAIEIDSYYYQNPTEKFLNQTSQQWQYFNQNSYSIYIGGVPVVYNVPMPNTFISGNSYIPKTFDYFASQCVLFTNLDIAGNTGFNQQNQTTLKQNNDFCNNNADCLSDYCIYGKCSGKSGGADCAFDAQCLSGACNSGKCANPGAWATIDSGIKSLFGSGTLDLSLISILIILLIGGALILITKGAIAGIVAALGISLILLFFFTFAGWLAPFIFVACILFILLGVLLFFIISQRGN